ncbi:MAG: hypothetical protein ACYCT7_04645 [bacterium]
MKLKLFLNILCITLIISGCAYNTAAVNKHLTKTRTDKLNGIMFAVLSIPVLKTAAAKRQIKYLKQTRVYIPRNMTAIIKIHKTITAKLKNTKKNTKIRPKIKISALKTINLKPYILTNKNNTIYLKINTKNKILIHKAINIKQVNVMIKGFKYVKGYEIVYISLTNNGNTTVINENFKYSNAGNSFRIKKLETIKNLTVASRYEKGITLWLNFV